MVEYDEHLDRALEQTPDIEEPSERLDVPDPVVRQEGNVTVFESFQATLAALGRDQSHVLSFLQDELGTSAHIDESGRARLTGSFDGSRIGAAVDGYAERFVRCPECGLPDTKLERESGVVLLRCEACGARSATSA